jgi:hypothetical protein
MSCSRPVRFAAAVALVLSLAATSALTASSEPVKPPRTRSAAEGVPEQSERSQRSAQSAAPSDGSAAAAAARRAAAAPTTPAEGLAPPLQMPRSYPYQPSLRTYPRGLPDQSDTAGLLGHDDLAPLLNAWMNRSNRISAQVVGQSTQGRDLYLVTLTAPESRAETARQAAWREQLRSRPAAAARNAALRAGYKTPIWFSANIHGNEWEGTDAAMQYIRRIVDAPDREVRGLLGRHRLYFSLTLNPDGRTLGLRATALGLNENRDMITNVTPESQSFVRTAQAVQALYAADLHGYTGVLQVEPCGPPHGENYEYDLFIPHGYAIARQVEDDVVAAAIPGNTYYNIATDEVVPENTGPDTAHILIPYRDIPSGWDDFPPIFTAQYTAFLGAVTSTVELPLSRPNSNSQTPANGRVNTAVALQTMTSMVDYVSGNSADMLADQIEFFRRSVAGEPKDRLTEANIAEVPGPEEWKQHWDVADNQDPVTLPRAYVIPVGRGQRSDSDATNVVRWLLFHGIEVDRLRRAARIGGRTYPAGSYAVDMHQPLRNLANSLLDLGSDISDKVPEMYDISAWSYSYLWGATVAKAGRTTDRLNARLAAVREPRPVATFPARRGHVTFDVAGVADYRALNALLERRVAVTLLPDGSAIVSPRGFRQARRVSAEFDVDFDPATPADLRALRGPQSKAVSDLVVGYAGTADDLLALTELGFDDLLQVTPAGLAADSSVLNEIDLLWIGGRFTFTPAQAAGASALQAWVDRGGSVVGSSAGAFDAISRLGLVRARAVPGNPAGNGIVDVTTRRGSILAPYAQDTSFIYPAVAFTDFGNGTAAQQTYDAEDPFLAGHWRPDDDGTGGPDDVAGLASVISGTGPSGSRAVVFGTSVFFRVHPKGGMSQAARAMFWAAPAASAVQVVSSDR